MSLLNILSIVTAFLEVLLLSGAIYGWPSLQYVLIQEGYFPLNCSATSNVTSQTTCIVDEATLNLVFTLATVALMATTFPSGYVLDRFGTWVSRIISCSLYTLGCALMSVISPNTSGMLFPAVIMIAAGGLPMLVTNVQLNNLTKNYKSVYVNAINGLFDSGVLTFFLVKLAYDNGITLQTSFQFLAGLSVFPWLRTFLVMPRTKITDSTSKKGYGIYDLMKLKNCRQESVSKDSMPQQEERGKSFKSCLKNKLFWTNLMFLCFAYLRLVFYLGSYISWLVRTQSTEDLDFFANLFGYILIAGGLTAPLNGAICEAVTKCAGNNETSLHTRKLRGLFVSMAITGALQIILSITVLVGNVYASLVALLFFRSFLFSSVANFLAQIFPTQQFGKLYGLTYFSAGLVGFLQYALFLSAADEFLFTVVNYVLLAAGCFSLLHPAMIFIEAFRKTQL